MYTDKELLDIAKKQLEFAYVPYSNFRVGAALLTKDGKVFTGCNIENATYGATNCAERTAVFKAVSEGYKDFSKIAVVSSGKDFTMPCGICRQVLAEFSTDIIVVVENESGDIKTFTIKELLPHNFTL